jgi:hypothetical protein
VLIVRGLWLAALYSPLGTTTPPFVPTLLASEGRALGDCGILTTVSDNLQMDSSWHHHITS